MAEKILIVDDDADSLKLIGLMLKRHGYEVVSANTGSQALARADATRPNLIILDVMMPDMNGLEVCRQLRANPNTNKIPIIMFTAKTLIDDKVKGFEAGADDYLTKPTHPAELASRVRAILARSAAKGEGAKAPAGPKSGYVIGVLGAKGGVGTTTVAANLAAGFLHGKERPVVADFRLGAGSLGLMLGTGRSQGMARMMVKSPMELNKSLVESELFIHASGLRALVCTSKPKETQVQYIPETAAAIVNALREVSKPTILDLGSGFDDNRGEIISELDHLLLVLEPTPIALAMSREIIAELQAQNSLDKLSVIVVTRTQSSLQTPWHEVERALGRDLKAIISAAPELSYQAIENQMPMVLLQPSAMVSGQFIKLAEEMKKAYAKTPVEN